jgi:hypothetical protein
MKKNHDAGKFGKIRTIEIPKDHLLQILQHEELLPADATKILGTGHRPESLTVTVGFD